jgi:hypothetical protein
MTYHGSPPERRGQLIRKASTGLVLAGLSGGVATGALAAALANQDQQGAGSPSTPTRQDGNPGTEPGIGVAPALPGPIQGGSNGS